MSRIILASASPRRSELMELLELQFEVKVSNADENISEKDPVVLTKKLSEIKAESVYKEIVEKGNESAEKMFIIIGADTVVFTKDNTILQKPKSKEEAREMIHILSGNTHKVSTGVTVIAYDGKTKTVNTFAEETRVNVAVMSDEEIEEYISGEEPYDKAGGYGIQGTFSKYITGIEGDYFNVVGLPVHRLYNEIKYLRNK